MEALVLNAETSEYAQRLTTFEGRAEEFGDFVYNSMKERKPDTDTLTVHAVNNYLDLIVASFIQQKRISKLKSIFKHFQQLYFLTFFP